MKTLILCLLSFQAFADCGTFFFDQTAFKLSPDEGKIFQDAPKFNSRNVELATGSIQRKILLFENGTAVEGPLSKVIVDDLGGPAYLGFNGKTQLLSTDGSSNFVTLKGQDYDQHAGGFGMPVGSPIKGNGIKNTEDVTWWREEDWARIDVIPGALVRLSYSSGVEVVGQVAKLEKDASGLVRVIKWVDGTTEVTLGQTKLFEQTWGTYDLLVGTKVINETLLK